jgi:hypothetical protein
VSGLVWLAVVSRIRVAGGVLFVDRYIISEFPLLLILIALGAKELLDRQLKSFMFVIILMGLPLGGSH